MLTKEHLRLTVRKGRAYPTFLDDDDSEARTLATEMIAVFKESAGTRIGELDEVVDALGTQKYLPAFKKLLLDQCDEEPDDGRIEAQRWTWLETAAKLRRENRGASVADFQASLGTALGRPFDEIKEELYGDLPACRRLSTFEATTPEALIARFNLGQVQGLLLRAHELEVRLSETTLPERRALFRQLKFHRLLGDVELGAGDGGALTLKLGGPLSIFDQAATYGTRLANFFPHVLHLRRWEVEADVSVKNRSLKLVLDQSSGLRSHYRVREAYVPEELAAFVTDFEARAAGWKVVAGEDFVHVGRQSYCFPDFTLVKRGGRRVHVELFHRWHAGQLLGRLEALARNPLSSLFLGVGRALARDAKVAAALEASGWFQQNGFLFSEFPTPKSLLTLLERA